MDQRIVQFIAALRAGGVRISLAESEDAFHAIEHLGIHNQDAFRLSLRTTLVKDFKDLPRFDQECEIIEAKMPARNVRTPSCRSSRRVRHRSPRG